MRHRSAIERARIAMRAAVCTRCWQRPPGSEKWAANLARVCEPTCTIFLGLPQLLAATSEGASSLPPDDAMRRFVCPSCHMSICVGEFCPDRLTRTCRLSRYAAEVLQVLDSLGRGGNSEN